MQDIELSESFCGFRVRLPSKKVGGVLKTDDLLPILSNKLRIGESPQTIERQRLKRGKIPSNFNISQKGGGTERHVTPSSAVETSRQTRIPNVAFAVMRLNQ